MSNSTWRQCGRKMRYRDEHTANYYRRKCEMQRGQKLDYYWCGYCNGFHLTSLDTEETSHLYDTSFVSVAVNG